MFNPEDYTYEAILKRMLAQIPDTYDKRPDEPIWNALAPAAFELHTSYVALMIYADQTYLKTAAGENLDNRGYDYQVFRYQATYAQRIIEVRDVNDELFDVPVGSRFSSIGVDAINFIVTGRRELGRFIAQCETIGTIGNTYLGELLPISNINGLGNVFIVSTHVPARDIETDEAYRARIIAKLSQVAFGGNVADYKRFTRAIPGVGDVKVFPIWNGGGTVKVSIVDSEYMPVSEEFVALVQEQLDPIPNNQLGLGIAPIGHRVTVVTPETLSISISAGLDLRTGTTLSQVQQPAEEALREHLKALRMQWADNATTVIYVARIVSLLINIPGVQNVADVTINGQPGDFALIETAMQQQIPVLGSVILHENH